MKYLFFDIECANCFHGTGKICEFGYVLTNDKFEILHKTNYIVNPNDQFDPFVEKKLLAYKPSAYYQNKKYPENYYKISKLINQDDIVIVGHTIDADAGYLNDESKRYDLPYLNYNFYDVKIIYKEYKNNTYATSVEKICEELNIPMKKQAHNALNDAEATMHILKELCKITNNTVENLLMEYPNALGNTNEGKITTSEKNEHVKKEGSKPIDSCCWKRKKIKLLQFLDGVQSQGEIVKSELNGKSVCITINYEDSNFKEVINIIQLLANRNCTYKLKATSCDYFVEKVMYDEEGSVIPCSRTKYVKQAIEEGVNIKIITLDELLALLDISEQELLNMPMPDDSNFVVDRHCNRVRDQRNDKKKFLKKTNVNYSTTVDTRLNVSIGELQKEIFDSFLLEINDINVAK